jgi:iron(III) transport system substrate-binding protein
MRFFFLAISLVFANLTNAFEVEERAFFGNQNGKIKLSIISTADIKYFAPMIELFLERYPNHGIDYSVVSSTDVMKVMYSKQTSYDLIISSAMDLQVKLANDGFARTYKPKTDITVPSWSVWNNMIFGFTQEPAAIVISKTAFKDNDFPKTRQELINKLRESPDRFKSRMGTYDLRRSGLGYLFATQDARATETYWRLTEVMGQLETNLYCCSSDMIDDVVSGKIDIAYNVLGSYANNHPLSGKYVVIYPADMTTVMSRSMILPKSSNNVRSAKLFIDHVLESVFESTTRKSMYSLTLRTYEENSLNRIRLGPGLMVFLDQFKKQKFLEEWENAILQIEKQ